MEGNGRNRAPLYGNILGYKGSIQDRHRLSVLWMFFVGVQDHNTSLDKVSGSNSAIGSHNTQYSTVIYYKLRRWC